MKFVEVENIFFNCIPRRYHRYNREFYAQIISLCLNIKTGYLFDLFPFSFQQMRNLLNELTKILSIEFIILKYSINDLIIVTKTQLSQLKTRSILLIDLTVMQLIETHSLLNQIQNHISWIDEQQIDLDNETNQSWMQLIENLNHTTVFGYLLGYPLVYIYSSNHQIDANTLKNFRLYIRFRDFQEDTLLYSFSCPIHSTIDQDKIESFVNNWFSLLSETIKSIHEIIDYRLERQTRDQSVWCL